MSVRAQERIQSQTMSRASSFEMTAGLVEQSLENVCLQKRNPTTIRIRGHVR